jgi:hypothetical protein
VNTRSILTTPPRRSGVDLTRRTPLPRGLVTQFCLVLSNSRVGTRVGKAGRTVGERQGCRVLAVMLGLVTVASFGYSRDSSEHWNGIVAQRGRRRGHET